MSALPLWAEGLPSDVISFELKARMRTALGLSPREFEIALYLTDGLSRKRTAELLRCSQHTLDSHIRRIYRKMHVSNAAAVAGMIFLAYANMT